MTSPSLPCIPNPALLLIEPGTLGQSKRAAELAASHYCVTTANNLKMTALPSLENVDLRKPHLHPVRHADLKQLYKRERHHLFFQMQTLADDLGESNSRKDHLGITTVELGKCLPWIPSDSTIVLYCSGGFSPMLRLQLSSLHTDRSLFLVDDDAPPLKSL